MSLPDKTIQTALESVGLPELRVIFDAHDIVVMEQNLDCRVPFAKALRLALEAFLHDTKGSTGQGHDTARAVVHSTPERFGLDPQPSEAEVTEALRRILADDPHAIVVHLSVTTMKQDAYRFPPEYGEAIDTNWVFRIIAPASWPFLQWSIVDIRAEQPAYSYLFD
jgi:hypothetical protein